VTSATPHDPLIEPDTKDWTWVLERRCPECGFDAGEVDATEVARRIDRNAAAWPEVLAAPSAARRPMATVWAPLEYACHVRDVHLVFAERVEAMLAYDDPAFANWDQDEAAVRGGYAGQDPVRVARDLVQAAGAVSALYRSVPDGAWERSGRRSNGSVFTISSLARYHLHDVVHHLWDVSGTAG